MQCNAHAMHPPLPSLLLLQMMVKTTKRIETRALRHAAQMVYSVSKQVSKQPTKEKKKKKSTMIDASMRMRMRVQSSSVPSISVCFSSPASCLKECMYACMLCEF